MIRFVSPFAVLVFSFALAAGGASIPVAALADGASYNDAGMHFDAPPDFEKLDVPPSDPTGSDDSDDPSPLAVFVYHKGKTDQRIISITVNRFEGPVSDFDQSHISDQRKSGEAFVAKNEKATLNNGMPAYYVKINSGAAAGQYVQRIEYLVCDGTRSIDVAYVGGEGTFDESVAKAALANLYVVVYPKRRA
jgi:hypothetical protein